MKLHIDTAEKINLVSSVEEGTLRIGQELHSKSVIVTPERIEEWQPRSVDELLQGHLETLAEFDPEVVILGTGARLLFPSPRLGSILPARGIGLEIMDTRAACRTYNLLAVDGRRALAALML